MIEVGRREVQQRDSRTAGPPARIFANSKSVEDITFGEVFDAAKLDLLDSEIGGAGIDDLAGIRCGAAEGGEKNRQEKEWRDVSRMDHKEW